MKHFATNNKCGTFTYHQTIFSFGQQGVKSGEVAVAAVDTAQGYYCLIVAIGDPSRLADYLRHLFHAVGLAQGAIVDVRRAEGFAFGRLDDKFWVESVEEALGYLADTIVDRQHHDECRRAHQQSDE